MIKMIYELVYKYDPNQARNKVTISSNGLQVFYGRGFDQHARSTHPIPNINDKIYTELTVTNATTSRYSYAAMIFGISNLGGDKQIGWSVSSGSLWYSPGFGLKGVTLSTSPLSPQVIVKGSVLGIAVDPINNSLTFLKNGSKLFAYAIDPSIVSIAKDKLFYFNFYNNTAVEDYTIGANFGTIPFKYNPPDGFISLEQSYKNLYKNQELKIY